MKKTYFIPVLALGLFLLSGCGLWSNFTTYFNLYYNAKDAFNDVELAIAKQNRSMFVLEQPKLPSEANEPLKKVIEKCSKLLQFKKESGYVDDALLMLGKAFFYQQDYLKSTRKFNELIGAYPESDLALEAELWIAKNELRTKDYQAGLTHLRDVRTKALEEDDDDIVLQSYAEEAAYYIFIGDIDNAIAQADKLMEISGNKTLSAEALYQIGLLHSKKAEFAKAADAFASVKKYSPSFEIEALSQIEYAKALREMGDYRGANKTLEDAESKTKYQDYYGLIEYETALTKIKEGDYELAFSMLTNVDTTYRKDSVSGMAQFQMAKLMEERYSNYDEAKNYYTKTASSQASVYYKTEARKRASLLTKYENIKKQIAGNSRDLQYIEYPETFIKDSADAVRLKKETEESSAEINTGRIENSRSESGGRGNAMNRGRGNAQRDRETAQNKETSPADKKGPVIIPVRPKISADSLRVLLTKNKLELGNFFLLEFNNTDSAAVYYNDILNNYKENIYTPQAIYSLANCWSIRGDKTTSDSLFAVVYEKYPNTELGASAADILKKPKIKTEYDPAENTYIDAERELEKGNYSVSISKMFDIYKAFPKSNYAAKALYSAGWIYENKLESIDSAISVYDTLNKKFPASEYAKNVNPKLSEFKKERERALILEKMRQDSIAAANKAAESAQPNAAPSSPADTLSIPANNMPANDANHPDTLAVPPPNGAKPDTAGSQPPKDEPLNQELLNRTLKQSNDGKKPVK